MSQEHHYNPRTPNIWASKRHPSGVNPPQSIGPMVLLSYISEEYAMAYKELFVKYDKLFMEARSEWYRLLNDPTINDEQKDAYHRDLLAPIRKAKRQAFKELCLKAYKEFHPSTPKQ